MNVRSVKCAIATIAAVVVVACAINPATGRKEFSLMSEAQEIQLGQEMDVQVRQEMGVYEDPELQRYVNEIGQRLAAASERPNLPWHFTVVDEPAINAFALPGGYIYITRGILPFLNDDAQLAGVIGHEIGHVTARHSAQQYTKATTAGVGLTLLSIFVPETQPLTGAAETALGVLFLKHGRDDERQADQLGVQYSAKTGWDPAGVAGMLNTLARLDEASGERRGVPNWLMTHPAPADRVMEIDQYVKAAAVPPDGARRASRDEMLRRVDGIIFGDGPNDGIIRGDQFLHPLLRIGLTFPQGWDVQNGAAQVLAKAPDRDNFVMLQHVPKASGSIEQVAQASMAQSGFRLVNGQRTRVNNLDAYVGVYQGALEGLGNAGMLAAHIVHDRGVYLVAGIAPADQFQGAQPRFESSIRSFRALTAAEAAAIRPNRIDIYTVRGGDTWESIAQRTSDGSIKASTLAIMNNYNPGVQPRAGERIKIVVQG